MVCITETWLNSDVTGAEVSLENYNIFRHICVNKGHTYLRDRQSGRRGGGVALYVKSELLRRCFSLDFNTGFSFAEAIACQIPHPSQLLTVLGVYRIPTSPEADDEQIIRAIRLIANQPGICLTLGDFNAAHINWHTGSCSVSNGFSMKLFEIAEEEFLFQAIKSPTRFREGNNPSILDLALTKCPDDVSSVQMLAPPGKSDHVVILVELQIEILEDRQLPSFSWFYQKTRRSELVEDATLVNWHQLASLECVTDMWHALRDWIVDLRIRFVP